MSEPAENALTRAARARRERGLPLADLTTTNPAEAGFAWDRARLAAWLGQEGCERHEPDPFGRPEARAAVSAYLAARGATVPPGRICLSASTSEAYAWWFRLLAEPGDTILAPEPAYPLIGVLAAIARVEVRPYRCVRIDGRWRIEAASLRPDARTRAIVAISPANPTGHALDAADRAALADACRRAAPDCALLIDEVFLDHGSGEAPARSALDAAEFAALPRVALSGLSKVALAPQLKVGWSAVAGPASWLEPTLARLAHHADAFLSVNTPAQVALPRLLEAAPPLRQALRARLEAGEVALRAWCAGTGKGCEPLPREAGWSAVVRLPAGVDELALCLRAVEEGALIHPGHYYEMGPETGACVVLSLLTPADDLARGLDALGRALARS